MSDKQGQALLALASVSNELLQRLHPASVSGESELQRALNAPSFAGSVDALRAVLSRADTSAIEVLCGHVTSLSAVAASHELTASDDRERAWILQPAPPSAAPSAVVSNANCADYYFEFMRQLTDAWLAAKGSSLCSSALFAV